MKLYVVTSGAHYDYTLHGIFNTKAKAEYAKKLFDADNEILEWKLNDLPPHDRGMFKYLVKIDKWGSFHSCQQLSIESYGNQNDSHIDHHDELAYFYVTAKNEKQAVKFATKLIPMFKEENWFVEKDL